jgi:hypothetical protein
MREEREKRTCIGKERTINKIGLIISNILEKLSRLIIPNRRSSSNKDQVPYWKNTRFHTSAV